MFFFLKKKHILSSIQTFLKKVFELIYWVNQKRACLLSPKISFSIIFNKNAKKNKKIN